MVIEPAVLPDTAGGQNPAYEDPLSGASGAKEVAGIEVPDVNQAGLGYFLRGTIIRNRTPTSVLKFASLT